jgi:tRNA 2-selenouridine synthase
VGETLAISLSQLNVEEWWEKHDHLFVTDVRSPREYGEDHLPGAVSMPVLTNEERARVGALYATSPFKARILGAHLIAQNIARILEEPIWKNLGDREILIYCWRGGQRSLSLGIVLKEIGFKVYLLKGGYRSYRRFVIKDLVNLSGRYNYWILSGPTGSGKTNLLHFFKESGILGERVAVLDLEGIAQHRGSVFGDDPHIPQPSQKLFESRLWYFFRTLPPEVRHIILEDESRRIGQCELPSSLWEKMKESTRILVEAPLEERIRRILSEYPIPSRDRLTSLLSRLFPYLGRELYHTLLSLSQEERWEEFVTLLLKEYYDPLYARMLRRREEVRERVGSESARGVPESESVLG